MYIVAIFCWTGMALFMAVLAVGAIVLRPVKDRIRSINSQLRQRDDETDTSRHSLLMNE